MERPPVLLAPVEQGISLECMNRRWILVFLLLAIFFATGIILGVFGYRIVQQGKGPQMVNTPVVIQQVRGLSELVTVQYVIEKVVILEDIKYIAVLGESRVLMVAHGIVKAGINLENLKPEQVKISGTCIELTLPPARITDAYLDEHQTRVVERTTGLLRVFDKDLEQTARQQAVDDIRRAARTAGIQKEADKRARLQLEVLFRQMGFTEVEFKTP